jgi:hypothetical protein
VRLEVNGDESVEIGGVFNVIAVMYVSNEKSVENKARLKIHVQGAVRWVMAPSNPICIIISYASPPTHSRLPRLVTTCNKNGQKRVTNTAQGYDPEGRHPDFHCSLSCALQNRIVSYTGMPKKFAVLGVIIIQTRSRKKCEGELRRRINYRHVMEHWSLVYKIVYVSSTDLQIITT